MSQFTIHSIQCPKCSATFEVNLCDSINLETDPELREALMGSTLNAVTCPECSFHFRVDKPLLYHDPSRSFMVFLVPAADDDMEKAADSFHASMIGLQDMFPDEISAPEVHLVHTRTELIERIFVLEEGLDERIIEYIKYTLYSQNIERLPPDRKNILFDAQDSDETNLVFVAQDVISMSFDFMLQYERSAYEALCETFDEDENTGRLLELFPGPHISARRLMLEDAGSSDT